MRAVPRRPRRVRRWVTAATTGEGDTYSYTRGHVIDHFDVGSAARAFHRGVRLSTLSSYPPFGPLAGDCERRRSYTQADNA